MLAPKVKVKILKAHKDGGDSVCEAGDVGVIESYPYMGSELALVTFDKPRYGRNTYPFRPDEIRVLEEPSGKWEIDVTTSDSPRRFGSHAGPGYIWIRDERGNTVVDTQDLDVFPLSDRNRKLIENIPLMVEALKEIRHKVASVPEDSKFIEGQPIGQWVIERVARALPPGV